ncbi:MAG TPA: ECF-type sigma factor [Patescibacteria group bacterium]
MDKPTTEVITAKKAQVIPQPIAPPEARREVSPRIMLTGENLNRFEAFYALARPVLLIRARAFDANNAEDLVQQVFEKELPYFARGDEITIQQAQRALRQIILSKIRHNKVRHKYGDTGSLERTQSDLGDTIFRSLATKHKDPNGDLVMTKEMMERLGSTLSPEQRKTLMVFMQNEGNISMKELADKLGMKESAAKMMLKRARDKIIRELEAYD